MMNENDVIDFLKKAERIGVEVWIDGGWGVDALVGHQTRPHNDIDIFIQKKDATPFIKMLSSNGYCETKMEYTTVDQGYEQKEKDRHDVLLLCETFGLSIPKEYKKKQ